MSKKILAKILIVEYLFISTIFIFGCNSSEEKVVIPLSEYRSLKGDTLNKPEYPKVFTVNNVTYNVYLGSDGHEYYEMYLGVGGNRGTERHFHYPNCKLCHEKKSYDNYEDK